MVVGDLVEINGERGVVCATEPLVMKSLLFHSFVPIVRGDVRIIERSFEPQCTIREAVLQRIRDYLDAHVRPTGSASEE